MNWRNRNTANGQRDDGAGHGQEKAVADRPAKRKDRKHLPVPFETDRIGNPFDRNDQVGAFRFQRGADHPEERNQREQRERGGERIVRDRLANSPKHHNEPTSFAISVEAS
jgi:hypothetical protein